jgi:hypothetical protein
MSSRREAIAKATTDTTVAAGGLLDPGQSKAFIDTIKDAAPFGRAIRLDTVTPPSGELNKLTTGSRIMRPATENADDGYRAEPTFPTVSYATVKVRLPWEVTEDVYQENIEQQALEARLTAQMTEQFGIDWDDLDVNGDTTDGSGDAAFLNIDEGYLRLCSLNASGDINRVDGSAINGGDFVKDHLFAALRAMPNKYVNAGSLVWMMSPARKIERATGAGDAALIQSGPPADSPLGISILEIPQFPDDRITLQDPRNIRRVVSWQVRRRRVTGETDWELATRDKRGYIFFLKRDLIIEEDDAVVDLHTLDPI